MVAVGLTFLTPLGALVALAALLPLAALAVAAHRADRVARLLRLEPAGPRSLVLPAVLAGLAFVALGVAAAQPALRTTHRQDVRTQSQVLFVVDVSRSMAASQTLGGPTRLSRARNDVARLRAAVPDVPSGLAGLTDRVLPYLFPTASTISFDETLRRSVLVETPPPQQVSTNATTFAALALLARDGFFQRSVATRTCVLVTDAETRSYPTESVARALAGPRGCRLLVVRVGGAGDSVFGADGTPEAGYAPDPAAPASAQQLAEATGGRAFDEGSLGAAASALRTAAEVGPVRREAARATTQALAPYAAGLATLVILALVLVRLRRSLHFIRTFA
ncbi:MAG: hypothetical protein QOF43_1378 [Gaiellaceae bacterium]|nr:hypothetical protein [Gaiellaceae bacterium]